MHIDATQKNSNQSAAHSFSLVTTVSRRESREGGGLREVGMLSKWNSIFLTWSVPLNVWCWSLQSLYCLSASGAQNYFQPWISHRVSQTKTYLPLYSKYKTSVKRGLSTPILHYIINWKYVIYSIFLWMASREIIGLKRR